uniref:Uncharacterized protein n=1 Tax=Cereibacter sphaeroides (strain ATCC 17025 / ATH 2.4.3) TaxID=349102 RepID=A4WS55_CERS5
MGYKLHHQPIAGESYRRCHQIIIDNPLDRAPAITFGQETIIGTGAGEVLHVPMAPISLAFDPAVEIPIVDPQTGQPTGATISQAEVYALIYSAYIAAAEGGAAPSTEETA